MTTVILSFDVEEHYRIEAAAGLTVQDSVRADYARRMEDRTRLILDRLAARSVPATFFVVGEIARSHPGLIRDIAAAGHEIGSHSWDHSRVHRFDPASFRDDLRKSKDALEQAGGKPVTGFRAPTFSVVRETGWAVDVLAECGFSYDSSIFPIRHDRYGIPNAPRSPFRAAGRERTILELPPATYRLFGQNLPVAGGGYFRLFPPAVMRAGIRQLGAKTVPPVAMLYFHPWEFDPDQPRLPLRTLSRWRTYVGIGKSVGRLERLMNQPYTFRRALDLVAEIDSSGMELERFTIPA
jgi:polysaccharide deacetylase family protein (PEP-CTERM system associated)